jgi:hypothetical protein
MARTAKTKFRTDAIKFRADILRSGLSLREITQRFGGNMQTLNEMMAGERKIEPYLWHEIKKIADVRR